MGCKLCGESWSSWYAAIVLMSCYAVGELGHFLIGIVSRPLAQDIEFGDQGCISTSLNLEEIAQFKCKDANSTSCSLLSVNGTSYCNWNYTGSGVEYQILAGPAFIAVFSVMGILIGVIGDMYNRVRLLTFCVFWYSLMCIITGFTTTYWQLILLRFGFGAGEAGVSPLTASIVADKFGARSRALAMSIFNWGIYFGYGLAFTVGNYVTQADIMGQGWRWSYFVTGIPGILMALLLISTVKEPQRKDLGQTQTSTEQTTKQTEASDNLLSATEESSQQQKPSGIKKLWKAVKIFASTPAILMLLLAASVRHTASFCWAYNTQLYFNFYYPEADLGIWMMLCSIVGGSIGIASGGFISDFVVSKYGVSTRLWVLVVSQSLASPLAAMVLYLQPPYCFITLLCAYLFAEMWYGVVMTVFVEIVPTDVRSTAVALFAFVISNIGGNLPVVVAYLKVAVGGLRQALYIMYPGFYLLSAFFFLLTQLLINRRKNDHEVEAQDPGSARSSDSAPLANN